MDEDINKPTPPVADADKNNGDTNGSNNKPGGSVDNKEEGNSQTTDKVQTDEIIKQEESNSEENNSSKLPITGQESILGVLSLVTIVIGGMMYKKRR